MSSADDINAKKKRIAIVTVSSMMLVAMVVAVAVGVNEGHANNHGNQPPSHHEEGEGEGEVHASNKAVDTICEPTQYKEACREHLGKAAGNITDPKELIKIGFNVTMSQIHEAIAHSSTLLELEKDPKTKLALQNCQELMDYAIDDLQRSFEHLGELDITKIDDAIEDLKVWLSAAMTYEDTCLEGFEGTKGKAGESMREALNATQELTNNALNMVAKISTILGSLEIPFFNRKLLSSEEVVVPKSSDEFPSWVSDGRRKLLAASPSTITPNVTVAKDGSGKYKTVKEAIEAAPLASRTPYVIYVKAGVYVEYFNITKEMTNIMLIGDGPTKTKLTNNYGVMTTPGMNTFASATVGCHGNGFMAKDIGFENTAGPEGHQAVALRVSSDMSIFFNVQIDGYQDTLYAHARRQFYRDCTITGTVDFIFGNALSLFQNCKMIVRKPGPSQQNMVTAQGRKVPDEPTGIILQECTISADPLLFPVRHEIRSFLGRPWKNYSRTVIMKSQIDDLIDPTGWFPWMGTVHLDTSYIVEYQNKGLGADLSKRVQWPAIKTGTVSEEALIQEFTATSKTMKGGDFIIASGVPFTAGL